MIIGSPGSSSAANCVIQDKFSGIPENINSQSSHRPPTALSVFVVDCVHPVVKPSTMVNDVIISFFILIRSKRYSTCIRKISELGLSLFSKLISDLVLILSTKNHV